MSNPTVKELLARNRQLEAQQADLSSSERAVRHAMKSESRSFIGDVERKAATLTGKTNVRKLHALAERWRERLGDSIYLLRKGGPTLLDIGIVSNEIHVLVDGPGMLFAHLKLLTDLDLKDGYSIHSVRAFTEAIAVSSHCGHSGTVMVIPEVTATRIGAGLKIGLGPMSMYTTELIIETLSGETFTELIERTLAASGRQQYLVALEAVAGTGHHEGPPHSMNAQGLHLQSVES